jgi:hypothetical protein
MRKIEASKVMVNSSLPMLKAGERVWNFLLSQLFLSFPKF